MRCLLALTLTAAAAHGVLAQTQAGGPAFPQNLLPADSAPLPPIADLLKAVEQHEDRDEALLQQYTYHLHTVSEEFDSSDSVKKTTVTDSESIPINGVRVSRVVARNGKPLTADEAKKEDERFDKEVQKARERKDKYQAARADAEQQGKSNKGFLPASRILQLGTFSNERRMSLNGRPTIVLDYTGNKDVKTGNPLERIVTDLVGTVWVDEEDKVLAQVQGHFVDDFKILGGLVADIHKGMTFGMEQGKINGEVWLPMHYGGQGKASFGLLLFRVHGREDGTASDYRKYHASATIVGTHGAIDAEGRPIEPQPAVPASSAPPAAPK